MKYIKLSHSVLEAAWNVQTNKWMIKIQAADGQDFVDHADVLINGSGILKSVTLLSQYIKLTLYARSNWKWPTITGLHDFHGKLMHSADWDESYDFGGKSVAIVGTGSSGVQITAALEPGACLHMARMILLSAGLVVKSMKVFIRSPIWVTPTIAGQFAGPDGQNFACALQQRLRLIFRWFGLKLGCARYSRAHCVAQCRT